MFPLSLKKEDFLQLGFISKIHSYKGEIIFISNGGKKIDISKQESVFIEINGQLVPFFIESYRESGDTAAIIKFEDVDDEGKARRFVSCGVFFPLSMVPEQKAGKAIPADLKGYKVMDDVHGDIGEITDILDMPQQLILEIHNGSKEILIPANEEIIYKIDKKKKIVFIDAPVGLIDLYLE